MKKLYPLFILACAILMAANIQAQRYVLIEASDDPANPANIFSTIMGDTTAAGARIDNNTIYQLENGRVYVSTGRIVNKPEWALQIEAVNLEDTDNKAILTRIPNASGDYQDIMYSEGNVTFKNLWIIAGETGPLQQHDWGRVRVLGENSRIIIKDCIIEKDRGGFLQLRADGVKCYVENSIFRNGGNRRILQGNGRGIDARNFYMDTLIMRNTIVHNIQDRLFRSQGATQPHHYIEIDHCTSFNTVGRHGHIQLGRVLTAKITNNLFINPIMMGTSPFYTDEQTQPDGDQHKVITIDTLYENTALSIAGNNIFWTQDVINYWATNDSVSMPPVLSGLVAQHLGAAASDAFFQEPLELNNVPGTILQYVIDLYNNPASENMYDFIVEDELVAGTPYDSGNLFDFSEFDPCYGSETVSATAGTDGGSIGAVSACLALGVFDTEANPNLAFTVQPNPVGTEASLRFSLSRSGRISLTVYDLTGRRVEQLYNGALLSGEHSILWTPDGRLAKGMYFAHLQTEEGTMALKLMLK
ncbi:MAG: T9SS type A sorting domain-containing protein [Phaeodactylibacter sp.]|nr:T9SS type A sorting domain-containing protein [Phaeodactylibacter sp.]MCB0614460.1 T9SS type A sorting domain-containing protein [Phaeodactylibacter sp.]